MITVAAYIFVIIASLLNLGMYLVIQKRMSICETCMAHLFTLYKDLDDKVNKRKDL
jgi:hypothetical protein